MSGPLKPRNTPILYPSSPRRPDWPPPAFPLISFSHRLLPISGHRPSFGTMNRYGMPKSSLQFNDFRKQVGWHATCNLLMRMKSGSESNGVLMNFKCDICRALEKLNLWSSKEACETFFCNCLGKNQPRLIQAIHPKVIDISTRKPAAA